MYEDDRNNLRRWRYYAVHAKKRRTRKKYQNKLRKYYASTPVTGGNWHYGSGAGMLPVPNPYTGEIDFRSMIETVRVPEIGARAQDE